jgi:predicted AlkP superfamily pyrophosphatase or phosphodiesterase
MKSPAPVLSRCRVWSLSRLRVWSADALRFCLLAALSGALIAASEGSAGAAPAGASGRPRLVVLLAIDQMRADYIDQYGGTWKHGLRRLIDRGALFRQARFAYLSTVTCPGHVTLGTGANPHKHGMVLNGWWDRAQAKMTECTADPASAIVSYGESRAKNGDSANNILIPTLGDEMKSQLGGSRVVTFSQKARSAIGLAGHKPDLVTWYEEGGWVTAQAFASEPNPVIARLIRSNPIDRALGTPWEKVLPAAAYKYSDDAPEERPPTAHWSRTFPKTLQLANATSGAAHASAGSQRYALWERSPLPDELLGQLAQGALSELALGKGPDPDYLAISFSALDNVGHAYGPLSHEVQDVLARLDRVLGKLLSALDAHLPGKYVVALSADHGVAVYPERLRAEGKDAGRIPMRELQEKLNAALVAELGPGKHIATVTYTDVYLTPGLFEKLRARPGALERAKAVLAGVAGVAAVFSTDQLRDGAATRDPVQRAAALSHYPGRSGDLIVVPKSNWLNTSAGTTHGSLYDYDQHVPVLFYGAGIRPGKYDSPASPADVAPTLASLLGVTMPHAEGTVLAQALSRRAPAAGRAQGGSANGKVEAAKPAAP